MMVDARWAGTLRWRVDQVRDGVHPAPEAQASFEAFCLDMSIRPPGLPVVDLPSGRAGAGAARGKPDGAA